MSVTPAVYSPESMRAEKRAVAGNSVLAAIAITTLKVVVGVSTGSLGILSEALHSALDLVAAIITLIVGSSIRQAGRHRPPVWARKGGELLRLP